MRRSLTLLFLTCVVVLGLAQIVGAQTSPNAWGPARPVAITNGTNVMAVDSQGRIAVTGTFSSEPPATQTVNDGGGSLTVDGTINAVCSGTMSVGNFPSTQAVTGTFWPATQPVSGTFWQATQPVSGSVSVGNFPASQAVTGTFWQATQPVSAASLPLPSGAATSSLQGTSNTSIASIDTKTPALGQATMANSSPVVIASNQGAVPVSGTFWQATQPVSGSVSVGNFPATQPVSGTFWQATQPVSGTFWQATQPVSGTFWQATQPVSGSVTANVGTTGGVCLDATLTGGTQKAITRGGAKGSTTAADVTSTSVDANTQGLDVSVKGTVPVSGTFWQTTQPVSGTFWQATQPVSAASLPLPTGAATEATLSTLNRPSTLSVTGTAAAGTGVTITLPAVASQFHYVSSLRVSIYNAVARTGGATPVVCTTTNLPGSLAFTFGSAGAVGTIEDQQVELGGNPLKSSVVNTASTIVCPATTSVIWRVTAFYQAAI